METKKASGAWAIVVRNWLVVALTFIGMYATLPFVAPTLMKLGFTGPANVLYTMYSPMCHQFAFRSIFLFGEQTFYPRESVGADLRPYEAYAEQYGLPNSNSASDFSFPFIMGARDFRGNEQMGYKTTLCARDVAIWFTMFVGGLIYAIPYVRKRLRPVPWWLYVLAGLGPIGLDGFSQLLSYAPFSFWEIRETAPFFRVATGAMFGLMNAWLLFPILERSFWEARLDMEGFPPKGRE
jgi:uncharacterized membrane protein